MMDFFSFDPAKLTDDELFQKQMELQKKIVWTSRFSSGEAVEQLQNILSMVEFERKERFVKLQNTLFENQFPAVIETEPDLREEPAKETRRNEAKSPMKRRTILPRTSRPISLDDPDNKDE